jgi:hypothetical protein
MFREQTAQTLGQPTVAPRYGDLERRPEDPAGLFVLQSAAER